MVSSLSILGEPLGLSLAWPLYVWTQMVVIDTLSVTDGFFLKIVYVTMYNVGP